MKNIILGFVLMISTTVFADTIQEFDETQEIKCHNEIRSLGCLNGDDENLKCVESKKAKLSKECKSIHESKKK